MDRETKTTLNISSFVNSEWKLIFQNISVELQPESLDDVRNTFTFYFSPKVAQISYSFQHQLQETQITWNLRSTLASLKLNVAKQEEPSKKTNT